MHRRGRAACPPWTVRCATGRRGFGVMVWFIALGLFAGVAGCGQRRAGTDAGGAHESTTPRAVVKRRDEETTTRSCRRLRFEPSESAPPWTSGNAIAWDFDGEDLLVASQVEWEVLRVELGGDRARVEEAYPELRDFGVYYVFRQGGGVLFGGGSGQRFLRYSARHRILEMIDIGSEVQAFNVRPLGKTLLALGKLHHEGRVRYGLFRLPFEGRIAEKAELLWAFPGDGGTELDVYRSLGGTFIAPTTEGRPALLSMERRPRILVEGDEGMEVLETASARLPSCSLCTEMSWGSYEEFGVLLDHLAAATMPRGLVGWGGELFVIVRQPWAGGDWRVLRIDAVRDEVLGTALLPSKAAALFAMPGPETWAFYEAERLSVGYMTNPSVWLVPAGEILGVDGESQVCAHGE